MPVDPTWFLYLIVVAALSFMAVMMAVSFADRDPRQPPAE